jgi:hypothetical protein
MPKLTLTFVSRRPWVGVALVVGVALAVIFAVIGLMMLPGILFGTRLTTAEAEESIRGHLLSQATTRFYERIAGATRDEEEDLDARYAAEMAPLKAVTFVSIDVDMSIFSAFKLNRNFVVEVVMGGSESYLSTHYFCFVGTYVTGECSQWHWLLAW